LLEPRYHVIKDFQFESGEMIQDMKLEYATQGIKKVDGEETSPMPLFISMDGVGTFLR